MLRPDRLHHQRGGHRVRCHPALCRVRYRMSGHGRCRGCVYFCVADIVVYLCGRRKIPMFLDVFFSVRNQLFPVSSKISGLISARHALTGIIIVSGALQRLQFSRAEQKPFHLESEPSIPCPSHAPCRSVKPGRIVHLLGHPFSKPLHTAADEQAPGSFHLDADLLS